MMTFIMMTISFTVAILLAAVISGLLLMQPKVLKWYMKYAMKCYSQMENAIDDLFKD